jgi:tRNA threonylcarbamoyladenosine biosynthesis protein TsaE
VVTSEHVVFSQSGVGLGGLRRAAVRLAGAMRPGDLVLLYGPLGVGKTTFVRAVAQALHVTDPVRSPSFTLANIYKGDMVVQHLDLYRLDQIAEDDALALEDYVQGDAVTLVEWPQAGEDRLGKPSWVVRLAHESLHERGLEIFAGSEEARRRWEAVPGHE